MSIISTNKRLIKVGTDYSAGSGISIDDGVISVTGEFGKTYSAGDNIDIYEQDEQLYISSKDWEQDIANASANAYNEAVAQIPDPFDPSYLSAQIDNKLNSSDFTTWQNGQYSTDLQTIEGQINNKLDTSSFSDVSGSFLTAINIPESATWNEVSQDYEQASGTYLTSVSIPESATWNEVSTTVQSNSAQWAEGGSGDEEVNSFVYNNSATINEVNTSYQTNSGDFLTAVDLTPYQTTAGMTAYQSAGDYVEKSSINTITGDNGEFVWTAITGIDNVWISASEAAYATIASDSQRANHAGHASVADEAKAWIGASGKLDNSASANFYPSNNPSGFITGVNLSNYYTKDETSGKEELSNAFANIPVGDPEVNTYVTDNSATINGSVNSIQTNSAVWNDVAVYQSNSGSYLTAHQDISNKLDVSSFSDVSGTFYTNDNPSGFITGVDLSNYYTKSETSGASEIADALANIPTGNPEVESYVQTNSAQIDETVTAFQTNSSTYMVEPNLEYNAVNEISGYNGSAIAQYGAEKQWLVHDDTIVSISNSAQYAFGCNISALQRLMGIDETVLWSGTLSSTGTIIKLNDNFTKYNRIKIITLPEYSTKNQRPAQEIFFNTNYLTTESDNIFAQWQSSERAGGNTVVETWYLSGTKSHNSACLIEGSRFVNGTFTNNITSFTGAVAEIHGIGRKQ